MKRKTKKPNPILSPPVVYVSPKLHPFLKQYMGYCFYKAAGHIRSQVDQQLAPFGVIAPQFAILNVLQNLGPLTQGELGHHMAIDKATMVRMIDGLEAKKFVTRVKSKTDRRANGLEVTKAGTAAVLKMNEARKRAEEEFLKPLTKEERLQLRAIVSKLVSPVE
jgi:DNA-binding MarR family transcriptional regulator